MIIICNIDLSNILLRSQKEKMKINNLNDLKNKKIAILGY
jgi:hypothetical protein